MVFMTWKIYVKSWGQLGFLPFEIPLKHQQSHQAHFYHHLFDAILEVDDLRSQF